MERASIAIDWGSLEDSFSEVEVVPSSASVFATTPTCAVKPELAAMSDQKLEDKIKRLSYFVKNTKIKSDGGEKLRNNIAQIQDELRRRETSRSSKDDGSHKKASQRTTKESLYRCSEPISSFRKSYRSYNTPLSVKNFYGEENVAFKNEFILLGRDKCKTMEKGKKLQASREPPSRSMSDRGHSRGKDKDQRSSRNVPSRSLSDRIRSRVHSAGYTDLSSYFVSKKRKESKSESPLDPYYYCRRKESKSESPLDSDSEKVTDLVLLDDDDDVGIPEQTSNKEIPDKWKECKIYYPSRNDPEAIELGYSDIKCLEPGEYLSSPVMNFYIKYLKQCCCQTSRPIQSFYIFNTYFYQKLEEALDIKDDGNSLFKKLRRWWKGVNIFEKAYIILPIHGKLHWSLVIICIPAEESQLGPIILHLDSLGCHSSSLIFDTIERYLKKEWHHLGQSDSQSSLRRIRKEKVSVPQQENDYDCGLFVLYFIERFISEAPDRFKNGNLDIFGRKWFKPEEASSLRQRIRELLIEELKSVRLEEGTEDLEAASSSSDSD